MDNKKRKRRILKKIVISEISGVDRPAQQGALVTIMKRAPVSASFERRQAVLDYSTALLAKYNHSHDEHGRFTGSGDGGGSTSMSSTTSSSDVGGAITQPHKDETLRWAQTAIRVAKIASWALVIPPMVAAFTAAAPVSATFAVGAALSTLVTRAALTRAAAFLAFDQGLSALIRHREAELSKAGSDDPILATLLAMQAELRANKDKYIEKFNPNHDQRGRFASGSGGGSPAAGAAPAGNETAPKRSRLRRALSAFGRGARATGRVAVTTLELLHRALGDQATGVIIAAGIGAIATAMAGRGKPPPRPDRYYTPNNVHQFPKRPTRRKPGRDKHYFPDLDKAMPQLTEQQARRLLERLPNLLNDEQVDKVLALLEQETSKMDDHDMNKRDDGYENLVKAEIGRSGMPRYIAEQRILAKYGSRPPAAQLLHKARSGVEFNKVVDDLRASGMTGTEAMRKARVDYPDEYDAYIGESS